MYVCTSMAGDFESSVPFGSSVVSRASVKSALMEEWKEEELDIRLSPFESRFRCLPMEVCRLTRLSYLFNKASTCKVNTLHRYVCMYMCHIRTYVCHFYRCMHVRTYVRTYVCHFYRCTYVCHFLNCHTYVCT